MIRHYVFSKKNQQINRTSVQKSRLKMRAIHSSVTYCLLVETIIVAFNFIMLYKQKDIKKIFQLKCNILIDATFVRLARYKDAGIKGTISIKRNLQLG